MKRYNHFLKQDGVVHDGKYMSHISIIIMPKLIFSPTYTNKSEAGEHKKRRNRKAPPLSCELLFQKIMLRDLPVLTERFFR